MDRFCWFSFVLVPFFATLLLLFWPNSNVNVQRKDTQPDSLFHENDFLFSKNLLHEAINSYRRHKYNHSRELLLQASAVDPFSADIYFNLAIVEETGFKHFEQAVAYYNKSIVLGYDINLKLKAMWNMAVCYESDLHNRQQALLIWKSMLQIGLDKQESKMYKEILAEIHRIEGSLSYQGRDPKPQNITGIGMKRAIEAREAACLEVHNFLMFVENFNAASVQQDKNNTYASIIRTILRYASSNENEEYFVLSGNQKNYSYKLFMLNAVPSWRILLHSSDDDSLCPQKNSVKNSRGKLVDRILMFQKFLVKISTSILEVHKSNAKAFDDNLNVLVVGGSVAGLSTAIESVKMGAKRVLVLEKRSMYKRKFWWDLTTPTIDKLKTWGYPYNVNFVEEVSGIHTVQCYALENFLSLIAYSLHTIEMKYNVNFESFTSTNGLKKFQILYGCDGTKSTFREYLGVPYMPQKMFSPVHNPQYAFGALPGIGKHLEQSTIILAFKMVQNGLRCPELRTDPMTGKVFSPFVVSFYFEGITSVFKRFNEPFCEMQLLFSNDFAKAHFSGQVAAGIDEDWYPWDILVQVCNFLVAFENVDMLEGRDALREKLMFLENDHQSRRHALYHRMSTKIAGLSSKIISFEDSKKRVDQLAILRGDALISAYYRLGIGINAIFKTLESQVDGVIWEYRVSNNVEFLPPRYRNNLQVVQSRAAFRMKKDVELMKHVQQNTMFYESYCDDVLVDATNFNNLVLMRKKHDSKTLVEIRDFQGFLKKFCNLPR